MSFFNVTLENRSDKFILSCLCRFHAAKLGFYTFKRELLFSKVIAIICHRDFRTSFFACCKISNWTLLIYWYIVNCDEWLPCLVDRCPGLRKAKTLKPVLIYWMGGVCSFARNKPDTGSVLLTSWKVFPEVNVVPYETATVKWPQTSLSSRVTTCVFYGGFRTSCFACSDVLVTFMHLKNIICLADIGFVR